MRSRDTQPELKLRRSLRELGLRYRIHVSRLPGTPDIVFFKKKVAVFVHGCYWHRHAKCIGLGKGEASTADQIKRFNNQVTKDQRVQSELEKAGWKVVVSWECAINKSSFSEARRIERVLAAR